jgi:predicted nuclease with TOPRIM domain
MADNIDLSFLGEQIRQVQSDVRQVRADQLRVESEQVQMQDRLSGLDAKVDRLDAKLDNGFRAVETRFDQVFQTIGTNLKLILEAIKGK